ncbi:MAG: EAL domain-containing protein [Uliginosibacterium sp.]|nr:EAL domain-containing protein [Uliginosibacterium sp.]
MGTETIDLSLGGAALVDDENVQFAEECAPGNNVIDGAQAQPWLILVADDDGEVHRATNFALKGVTIDDRPLRLLHAHSAAEAEAVLRANQHVAVAMLDVVMETPDAGLRLVEVIRSQLGLQNLRIILRTGQPGYAPELEVIRSYDINDYRTKSELTQTRLITTLTAALRAFNQLELISATKRGMDAVSRASNTLLRLHTLSDLAMGLFERMASVTEIKLSGFVCVEHAMSAKGDEAGLNVLYGVGTYASLAGRPVSSVVNADMHRSIRRCIAAQTHVFESDRFLLWFSAQKVDVVAVFEHGEPLAPLIQQLVEMFAVSLGVGFENADLIERLDFFAHFDPLTHLANRTRFVEEVSEELFRHQEQERALAIVDVVRFSDVNESLGFRSGDSLLMLVSKRLRAALNPGVRLARLSGDTFGLFGQMRDLASAEIHQAFQAPFFVHGHALSIQVRVGVVRVSDAKGHVLELLRDANLALSEARRSSGAVTTCFSAALSEDANARINLLHSLRAAIDFHRGISLHFQPILDAFGKALLGIEALLRWRNESGQMVAPAQFIPLAEQTGMINELGQWVLETALARFAVWQRLTGGGVFMSLNLSPVQFRDPQLSERIKCALEDNDIAPQDLVVDLTEAICAEDRSLVLLHLRRLRALGVRVAIDDFGSGGFSLRQLMEFPVDIIKIDRSFVADIVNPEDDISFVRTIGSLAQSRGMKTVAEGVETPVQQRLLAEAGCDAMQGFHLCRPLPADSMDAWLRARASAPRL